MEQEQYLKEQIEMSIDQLDLLKLQDEFNQDSYNKVIEETISLILQYNQILAEKTERGIQDVERRATTTVVEEYQKRQDIYLVAHSHVNALDDLLSDTNHAPELRERLQDMLNTVHLQADGYQKDVELIKSQLEEVKNADQKEADLEAEKMTVYIEYSMLRRAQLPYHDLGLHISEHYNKFIKDNGAEQINLVEINKQKEILLQRQKQLIENLELARKAKNAKGYVETYEKKLNENKLEIDKLDEKIFIYLASKIMLYPVNGYESLEKRTNTLNALIEKRINTVEELYKSGVVKKSSYKTVALEIDHSEIEKQLSDIKEMQSKEKKMKEIEEELKHLRDHIKGRKELEQYIEERQIESGRTPAKPSDVVEQEPEIIEITNDEDGVVLGSDNSYDGYEQMSDRDVKRDKRERRKLLAVEQPSQTLLERLFSMDLKGILISSLAPTFTYNELGMVNEEAVSDNVAEPENGDNNISDTAAMDNEYSPSIGDKIQLKEGAMIYSNSNNTVTKEQGYDAMAIGVANTDLYITRGVVLDAAGNIVYATVEYGANLKAIAESLNLADNNYSLALGCALGDAEGNFIPVPQAELNPIIEKGWISSEEKNLTILERLDKIAEKGSVVK